jgi:predicted ATP-dependent endonuclease of OLD family
MQYLNTNTECQYLISTHSAHLIDSGIDASVFKVWMEKDHTTHLAYAGSNADKLEICNLLGYKASDLLQSNCVIWVEGPSDRLYLNYWIHGKASDLIEGVHYSIMFYGGRLLSHLSGDDDKDEKNPINLLRINRHSWILIDSDKEREDDTINGTKQRIQEEFKDHCWVTEGREIENYLPKADFEAALRKTEVPLPNRLHIGKYDNRLKYSGKEILPKVTFASKFVKAHPQPDYDTDDLDAKIGSMVIFIRKANQQEPTISS